MIASCATPPAARKMAMGGEKFMLKKLLSVILMLSILLLPGCGKREDAEMNPIEQQDKPTRSMVNLSESKARSGYRDLLKDEKEELLGLLNWLYEKEGSYSLKLDSAGPHLKTNKGAGYGLNSENTRKLIKLLKKHQLEEVSHEGPSKDTVFTKTEMLSGLHIMHHMYYHVEEKLDPKKDSYPLSKKFYYNMEFDTDSDEPPFREDGPTKEMYSNSSNEGLNEYKELLKNEKAHLIKLMDWLYAKKGYYFLSIHADGPCLENEKGEDYGLNSENTKQLLEILKKYNLESVSHTWEDGETTIKNSKKLDNVSVFLQLIYCREERADYQERYIKIADHFYYRYAVGE